MVCEDTLRIKNLPKELSDAEKEEFLRHFGAIKVKIITSKAKQKAIAYAKFESKDVAKGVLQRLHQLIILKSRLCVEYAEHDIGAPKLKRVEETDNSKTFYNSFINKLNAFNNSVEFNQPPPPHLKYLYPKANRPTINNIGHALATIPKFYTQVLHLMNRMNLPPPFALPDPSRQPIQIQQKSSPVTKPPAESSSESELESEEDSNKGKEIIPQKRKLNQKKAIKRPKFIKPPQINPNQTAMRSENSENVFEKVDVHVQKKIELRVDPNALENKTKLDEPEFVGSIPSRGDENNGHVEEKVVITEEELSSNRIPAKDLDVIPVFKNYHPGVPSCRLYIKNIAKNVEIKDLEYIYNRYKVEGTEENPSLFEIKLMQEGRMKGQAFVTVDNIEIAQKAVKETNAYILKDKPLVVVFGRSVVAKKT